LLAAEAVADYSRPKARAEGAAIEDMLRTRWN